MYNKITENFDLVTEQAVKNFQKAKGLKDDGKVDPTIFIIK
jgi:peptidoglycan hydrolase-like protein with peptidoglycan-binding domain